MEELNYTSTKRPSVHPTKDNQHSYAQSKSNVWSTGVIGLVIAALIGAAIASVCFVFAPMIAHGGAAAKIDGTVIKESDVTAYVDDMRKAQNLTDDAAWSDYMKQNNTTAASVRRSAIQSLETSIVVDRAAKELGVSVSDDEINDQIASMKEQLGDEAAFESYMTSMGMSEEQYRNQMKESLLEQAMQDKFAEKNAPTDEELVDYINSTFAQNDTPYKKVYALSLNTDTDADLIAALDDGSKTFEDAVKDQGNTLDSVSLGWIAESSFDAEAIKAINAAPKNSTSAAVESSDGMVSYFMWTDSYTLTAPFTSFDGMSEELTKQLKESAMSSVNTTGYNDYMIDLMAHMETTIYAMPSGLSYDVK